MSLSATTALIAVTGTTLLAGPPRVVLSAPGHSPTIGRHWSYRVQVTEGGRPVAATITAQIVDPVGGVHLIPFGPGTTPIRNWGLRGTFTNFITFPTESRGIPLTIKMTIRVGGAKSVASYPVTPVG